MVILSKDASQPAETAIDSAAGNLCGWFLKANKDKGRPLEIPRVNLRLNADGTTEKIDVSKP
jgi:hypothetical protein